MKRIPYLFIISPFVIFIIASGLYVSRTKADHSEALLPVKSYSGLILEKTEELHAQSGVKSVLFNSSGTKLYALNLEAMSIYEFDRESKKLSRELIFQPTEASGWDYKLHKAIPSFAEKPVEACFSHDDKILWVSLHNAGGIVPVRMDSLHSQLKRVYAATDKQIYITDLPDKGTDTISVPLIKTGKTPKVIAKSEDSKYLLVSNWHSETISVLRINDTLAPYATKIASIPVQGIPRGISVDNKNNRSYVTIMSGSTISVINNKTWKIEKNLQVAYNPRHVVADSYGRLFVSFNALAQLACISASTGKLLFKTDTHGSPRTIVLSKNQKFLFVTCYADNTLDIFKINIHGFSRIASLKSDGNPVGADIYEDENVLEVWVCNWMSGVLKVFTFRKV